MQTSMMVGEKCVTVGIAGDLISEDTSASIPAAKAGGRPHFFGNQAPVQASDLSCCSCNGPLSLVAQAQLSPLKYGSGDTIQTLYIFCCTHESCASITDSWHAYIHSIPKRECNDSGRQNMGGSTAALGPRTISRNATGLSQKPAAVGVDAWGLASDDWGISSHKAAGADTAELNSALEQLSMQAVAQPQEPARRPKAAGDRQQTGHSPEEQGCSIEGLPCLPAFELWLQPELGKAEARLDRADNIEQAISAYEQSSASEGTQSAGSKQPEGSWAHEQYEEDAAFSKYTKRLQRCPGQCLRLSASGSLLWPRKELPVAPRCAHCQAEKRCIAQLMAPLIAMFHEAADWVVEAGEMYIEKEPVEVPLSWEWLTVAIFACSGQCTSRCPTAFEEETVIAVNETVTGGGWAY